MMLYLDYMKWILLIEMLVQLQRTERTTRVVIVYNTFKRRM
jgi:hypothetical protein